MPYLVLIRQLGKAAKPHLLLVSTKDKKGGHCSVTLTCDGHLMTPILACHAANSLSVCFVVVKQTHLVTGQVSTRGKLSQMLPRVRQVTQS